MESHEQIRSATITEALEYLADDDVNAAVSSSFYKDARSRLDERTLGKVVVSKPDSTSSTALAKTIAAIGGGRIYRGRITLYKPFFSEFNIAVGSTETGQSLGLSMQQRRTIVLLHELTHLTRRYIDVFQLAGLNYFDEAIYDKATINMRIYEVVQPMQ